MTVHRMPAAYRHAVERMACEPARVTSVPREVGLYAGPERRERVLVQHGADHEDGV